MGGGAFILARRGTIYVTPGPYLPIAKIYKDLFGIHVLARSSRVAGSLIQLYAGSGAGWLRLLAAIDDTTWSCAGQQASRSEQLRVPRVREQR